MKQFYITIILAAFAIPTFAQHDIKLKTSIRLVRNATIIIDYGGQKILLDPMLSPKGTFDSFAGIERNPTVDLKMPVNDIIKDIDLLLVTHIHPDHFDEAALEVLEKSIKLIHQPADREFFQKEQFSNTESLSYKTIWNNISIYRTEATHGSGRVLQRMGYSSGFILEAQGLPTIYIVGDAIWTDDIYQNIKKFNPDYIIVNSGGASFPDFKSTPIIMDEMQTMSLIQESGKAKVIAVHMDAIDHCNTTRSSLRLKANELNIGMDKLIIPLDGEKIELQIQN